MTDNSNKKSLKKTTMDDDINFETGAIIEFTIEGGECVRRDSQTGERLELTKSNKLVLYSHSNVISDLKELSIYDHLIKFATYDYSIPKRTVKDGCSKCKTNFVNILDISNKRIFACTECDNYWYFRIGK